jgi:hypothetical protein
MVMAVKEITVKIVTIKILVVWATFTQQLPLTTLDAAPNEIMKNKNHPINFYWPKASARSVAAAYTKVYALLLRVPTKKSAKK